MKVVAFVPIRLNSKRIVSKNMKMLGNKPLLSYIFETLKKVKNIDEIYAYCSSGKIKAHLPENIIYLKRDRYLDGDNIIGKEIYSSFIKEIHADVYILAHTTSPFIKPGTIQTALNKVLKEEYDSSFSVKRIKTFIWYKNKPLNYKLSYVPQTQKLEPIYIETSAFYIFKKDIWNRKKQRIGDNPFLQEVNHIEAIDIDEPMDFQFAEHIVKLINKRPNRKK
jgi:CMP-N-acetylneuraminic acid synthetase